MKRTTLAVACLIGGLAVGCRPDAVPHRSSDPAGPTGGAAGPAKSPATGSNKGANTDIETPAGSVNPSGGK